MYCINSILWLAKIFALLLSVQGDLGADILPFVAFANARSAAVNTAVCVRSV